MVDEELAGQMREISGDQVVTCDLCGQSVTETITVEIGGDPALGEPPEVYRICVDCWAEVKQGERPFRLTDEPGFETE